MSKTTAYLLTDSRYWLQAEKELDENWRLIRLGMELGPRNWVEWISVRAPFSILWAFTIDASFLFSIWQDRVNESRVGVDARMISNETAQQLYPLLQARKSKLVYPSQNLIDLIWVNKPVRPKNKIFVQPIEYTGESNTLMFLLGDSFVGNNTRVQAKMPQENLSTSAIGSEITLHQLVHHHPRTHRRRLSDMWARW